MLKTLITNLLIGSVALLTFNASAANSYFEARNDAMGGTGVASSHYSVAPLSNPALLTNYQLNDHFSILLMSLGGELNFPNGIDYTSRGEDLIRNNENSVINAQSGMGFVIAIPTDVLSVAFMAKSYIAGNTKLSLNSDDIDFMTGKSEIDENTEYTFNSSASGKFAAIVETGLAFAKQFESKDILWAVGVTPKYQCVAVVAGAAKADKTITQENHNDFKSINDLIDYNTAYNYNCGTLGQINADIGATLDLANYVPAFDHLRLGIAVQNIISRSINAKKSSEKGTIDETFNIRPQVTTGIALNYGMLTGALDVDLTPTSGFLSESKRQFASVGGEIDLYKWAQLRAGYRYNMLASGGNAITAGIGFSPFDVIHFDVTSLIDTEMKDVGTVAQINFTF